MSSDLISRSELKKAIKDEFDLAIHNGDIMLMSKSGIVDRVLSYIDSAPTVSDRTEEVLSLQNTIAKLVEGISENTRQQGEWIYHTDGYIAFYTCSRCNGFGDIDDKFCSHCGATMEAK